MIVATFYQLYTISYQRTVIPTKQLYGIPAAKKKKMKQLVWNLIGIIINDALRDTDV